MEKQQSKYENGCARSLANRAAVLGALILLTGKAWAAEIHITIKDRKQLPVHDTVVELVGTEKFGATSGEIEISQKDEEFDPLLTLMPRGTRVRFTNQDPSKHHVYSVSPGNEFDLPLFHDESSSPVSFDTPGVVKMGCNIHDWMLAFGYVSESENLVLTDSRGSARFSDFEGGDYTLKVWNPRLKNNRKVIVQSISLEAEQTLEHTVEVSLRKKIRKPARKQNSSDYSGNN